MFQSTTFSVLALYAGLSLADPGTDAPDSANDKPNPDRFQLEIDEHSALHGPYDPQLAELLSARGEALQHQGNHAVAVKVLERALHINRINHGIYSFQQEAVIRALIDSFNLLGAYDEVGRLHQQLAKLQSWQLANNRSEALIPMLLDSSNWHRSLYLELSSSINVPHLRKSIRLARAAHSIASEHNHEQLIESLEHIAESNYYLTRYYQHEARFFGSSGESMHTRLIQDGLAEGIESYEQIIAIHQNNNSSPKELALAQIALGDYLQLFRKHDESHKAYVSAWNTLNEAGDTDSLERLLGKPVKLPSFDSNPPVGTKAVARVKADIGPTGRATNVEVLETWPADNRLVVQTARRAAQLAVFRNQVVDGKVTSGTVEFNLLLN